MMKKLDESILDAATLAAVKAYSDECEAMRMRNGADAVVVMVVKAGVGFSAVSLTIEPEKARTLYERRRAVALLASLGSGLERLLDAIDSDINKLVGDTPEASRKPVGNA